LAEILALRQQLEAFADLGHFAYGWLSQWSH
jgi:hypothetical protein